MSKSPVFKVFKSLKIYINWSYWWSWCCSWDVRMTLSRVHTSAKSWQVLSNSNLTAVYHCDSYTSQNCSPGLRSRASWTRLILITMNLSLFKRETKSWWMGPKWEHIPGSDVVCSGPRLVGILLVIVHCLLLKGSSHAAKKLWNQTSNLLITGRNYSRPNNKPNKPTNGHKRKQNRRTTKEPTDKRPRHNRSLLNMYDGSEKCFLRKLQELFTHLSL